MSMFSSIVVGRLQFVWMLRKPYVRIGATDLSGSGNLRCVGVFVRFDGGRRDSKRAIQ